MDWSTGKILTPTTVRTAVEVEQLALTMAGRLRQLGVTPGARVMLCADNSADYLAALLALMHLNTSIVLVDCRETPDERARLRSMAKSKWTIVEQDDGTEPDAVTIESLLADGEPGFEREELMSFGAWHARTDALVTWSSGSTGQSKGIVRSGRGFLNDLDRTRERMGYRADDVLLPVVPFSHFYGLTLAVLSWTVGCSLAIAPRDRLDRAIQLGASVGATVVDGTPSTYHSLLNLAERRPEIVQSLSSVRMFCVGGAPLSASLAERFRRTFNRPLLDGYGSNEAGNIAMATNDNPLACGRPLPDIDVLIRDGNGRTVAKGDVGEIFVSSPSLMEGYLNEFGTITPIGSDTYATNDLGYETPDGNICVLGRKYAVHRMGYTLYPEAIERKAEVCGRPVKIIAVDDERKGSQLVFFVEDPNEAPAAGWRSAICSLLPSYEHPSKVIVLPTMPLNRNGKPDNKRLRALAEGAVFRSQVCHPETNGLDGNGMLRTTEVSAADLSKLPFPERAARIRAVTDFIRANRQSIIDILTGISNYRSVELEIDASLHTLAGAIDEVIRNKPPTVPQMAIFMSSNVLLYSYTLYLLIPSLFTEQIVARPSSQAAEETQRLHELLAPVHGLPITLSDASQRKFVQGPAREAKVVVFTGKYQNAEAIRAELSDDQLFMLFGQGANPFIVAADTDVDLAVMDAIRIRMLNSGQDCFGPDIFFVHESETPRFVDALVKRLSTSTFGDNDDPEADYGPMSYAMAMADATQFLSQNGKHIIYGGQVDFRTRQIQPAVLLRGFDEELAYTEIFSPIFNIVSYNDQDRLQERLRSPYFQDRAMGAMVYGHAPGLVEQLSKRHMVAVNQTLFEIDNGNEPFGGRGIIANYVSHKKRRRAVPLLISQVVAEEMGEA